MKSTIVLKKKPRPFPKLMHSKWDDTYVVLFKNESQGIYLSYGNLFDYGFTSDKWNPDLFEDHDKPFILAANLLKWVVEDKIREVVLNNGEGGTVVYPPNLMGEWRETVDDYSPLEGSIVLSN